MLAAILAGGLRLADAHAAFIHANTAVEVPPLIPEIRLHLATEIVPIWRATEEELAELGVPPPYWAFAWAGGQALARYILDNPEIVAGRAVLDFASGSGLAAIAAAMAGAATVTAADIDPYASAAIGLNAALNGVSVEVTSGDIIGSTGAVGRGPGRRHLLRAPARRPRHRLAARPVGSRRHRAARRSRAHLPAEGRARTGWCATR